METAPLVLVQGEGAGAEPGPGTAAGPWSTSPPAGASRAAPENPTPVAGRASRFRERVVDAALECLAERGVSSTTADDIARRAGCSRATVYRVFPGGKDAVLAAVVETEVARCMAQLAVRMGGATTAEDVVVEGVVGACRWLAGNRALAKVLADEPGVLAPLLAFERESEILGHAAAWAAPFLGRWLAARDALRVAEWAARLVLVYGLGAPVTHDPTDERWVRHLVRTFVTPGIEVLRSAGSSRGVAPKPGATSATSTGGPSGSRPDGIHGRTGHRTEGAER